VVLTSLMPRKTILSLHMPHVKKNYFKSKKLFFNYRGKTAYMALTH